MHGSLWDFQFPSKQNFPIQTNNKYKLRQEMGIKTYTNVYTWENLGLHKKKISICAGCCIHYLSCPGYYLLPFNNSESPWKESMDKTN